MKSISFLLFLSFSFIPCISVFAQNGEVPFGQTTTNIATVEPMYKDISITKDDNKYYAEFLRINKQISLTEMQIASVNLQEQNPALLGRTAPEDNTRVNRPVIPEAYQRNADNISQKLELKKQDTELSQKENLSKQLAALKNRRQELLKIYPNMKNLNLQQEINDAYALYTYAKHTGEVKKLPEYKLSPSSIQAMLKQELMATDTNMKLGPGYKSYIALEKEIQKINRNNKDNAILMSIFTFVIMRKFNGFNIAAPASALHWWSGPMWGFYAKKLLNFIMVIGVYTAIDEANLKSIGASFEEMITRFTFLEDNYSYLKALMAGAQKNTFTPEQKNMPSSWINEDEHRSAIARLYGLRFINTYLRLSTVSYKYDLALMDLINMFSSNQKQQVFFDFNEFSEYELHDAHWEQTGKTNAIAIKENARILERTPNLINNLKLLPRNLSYKKVYYKALPDNEENLAAIYFLWRDKAEQLIQRENGKLIFPVPPEKIIRDNKGNLQDCTQYTTNRFSGEIRGTDMQLINGGYYMRIEPAANDKGTFYRDKPNAYVFEDINTKAKECGLQTNMSFT